MRSDMTGATDRSDRREQRREELLDAALGVIRREGRAASMEAMAAAARITKPILYRYFGDREGLARARNPARFRIEDRRQAEQAFQGLDAAAAAAALRQRLQALGAGLPVLYRQYVDLCEPDGVRFLGFGVDPGFGHCVDGLIRLDLARLRPARRERYLGRGGAVARA